MRRPPLAVAALLGAVAGVLSATQQFLPVVLHRPVTTVGVVLGAVSLVSILVSPVAVFAVGYWAGRDVDVASRYGRLAVTFGLVAGVASLVGYVVVAVGVVAPDTGREALSILIPAAYTTVVRGLNFAITGLAGAAVAQFRGA